MFLPINLDTCSAAERNRRLARRHAPVTVVRSEQQLESAFSHDRYAHLLRPPEGASLAAASSERETVAIRLVLPAAAPRDSAPSRATRPSSAKGSLKEGTTQTPERYSTRTSAQLSASEKLSQKNNTSSKAASSQKASSRSVPSAKPPPARRWWQSSAESVSRGLPFGSNKPISSTSSSPTFKPR